MANNCRTCCYFSIFILFVFFVAIIATVLSQNAQTNEHELKLVHVIFRHGVRTPADTYPTDPLINSKFEPFGWGQLTNKGKLQLYELGKYLRKTYNKFLGDLYTPDICHIQTTDVDRTKMSAQCLSAGLWPPTAETKFGPLDWQPIGLKSEPLKSDSLLLVRLPCAQYSLERESVENSEEVQKVYADNKDLFEKLTKYTGRPVKNAEDILDVQGTLSAELEYNETLVPQWAKDIYPQLLPLSAYSFVLNAKNTKLQRLKGGVFLKEILKQYQDVANSALQPENRKLFLFGGHDSTIANLLSALQVWDPQIPGYAITIILELRKNVNNNELGLQVYLKNNTNQDPYPLTIPGCEFFCPLNQVLELTKPVIPDKWEEECETDIEGYMPPPPSGP